MNKDSKAQLHLDYGGGQRLGTASLIVAAVSHLRELQYSTNLLLISHSF
jgi:hypothetical protein